MHQSKYLLKNLLVFSLFLSAILTVTGCESFGAWGFSDDADALATGGSIYGKVTASSSIDLSSLLPEIRAQAIATGVAVPGATVWVEDYPDITATADGEGNYVLQNVPFGSHRIVARFTIGTGSNKQTYKVRSSVTEINSPTSSVPVLLRLQIANNTVSGILTGQDGNPIINAKISVWGETVTTDGYGRFEMPPLPEGSEAEVITIIDSAGQKTSQAVVFGPAGTSFVELYLPEPNSSNIPPRIILLRESPAISIAPGATTILWAIYADPDGEISEFAPLEWAIPGATKVSSSLPLPASLKEKFNLFSQGLAESKVGAEAISYTTPSGEGYSTISVTCKDKGGLRAVAGLKVPVSGGLQPPAMPANHAPAPVIKAQTTVSAGSKLALTCAHNDPDGDFGLSYLWSVSPAKGAFSIISPSNPVWTAPTEAGVYTISCRVSDGKLEGTATHDVTVVSDTPIASPGKISGYVRDDATEQPVANAFVTIAGTSMYVISDANGRFEFNDLKAGTYTLIVTRNNYQIKTFTGIVVPAS